MIRRQFPFSKKGAFAAFFFAFAIAFFSSGCAPFPRGLFKGSPEPPTKAPTESFTKLNDTARFLAGMPGGGNHELRELRSTTAWKSHASRMDQLWGYYQNRVPYLEVVRTDAGGAGTVFYPFGGPDYLWARTFFPGGRDYILVGLEGVSSMPEISSLSPEQINTGLAGLSNSLKTVTGASYFITKDMRVDLEATEFRGTLPPLLVMCARSGDNISSVTPVGLGPSGELTSREGGGGSPGWHIVAGGKNIYYFRKDLSNDGMADGRIQNFVRSKGAPATFLKSASYLMHTDDFSAIRNFILSDSRLVLQDPSGVPFRYYDGGAWNVRLYGNYTGPLEIFSEYRQDDLISAYQSGRYPVTPIKAGVGYLRSCLILAKD
jgi:hypothetical protein